MEPNQVPLEHCHRWIFASVKLGERHYTLFLICGLITTISLIILNAIPYIGSLLYMVLSFFYIIGSMRMTEQIIKYDKGTVDDFLKYVFEVSYFKQFQVHLIALIGFGLFLIAISFFKIFFTSILSMVLSTLVTQLLSFSAFMMLHNSSLPWKSAFEKIFSGFTLNLGAWVISLILLAVFAIISIVLCLAPFLLYFVPMTFGVSYLIYSSIYENLNVESLITEWSSKPPIETHTLPPEA